MVTSDAVYVAGHGLIVSLTGDRRRPRSPIGLTVPGFAAACVLAGSEVTITGGVMKLGGLSVSVSRAPVWSARRSTIDRCAAERLGDSISVAGANSLRAASTRIGARLDAVVAASAGELRDAVQRLIGFGPGLTPSGDDALAGLIVALSSSNSCELFRDQLVTAVLGNLHLTADISAQMLDLACHGLVNEAVDAVLVAGDCEAAVLRLLGVGATSGADTLLGIVAGLRLAVDQFVRGTSSYVAVGSLRCGTAGSRVSAK